MSRYILATTQTEIMESLPIQGRGKDAYYVIVECDSGRPLHRTRNLNIAAALWNPGTFMGQSKAGWDQALKHGIGAVNRRRTRLEQIRKEAEKLHAPARETP